MPTTITNLPTKIPGVITNQDLVKGLRVRLANGWEATLLDSCRTAKTRLCEVYGIVTESGSVYAKDITQVQIAGEWLKVRYLPSLAEAKALLACICPNISLSRTPAREFRVAYYIGNARGITPQQVEACAYYTTDLLDAIDTAKRMAHSPRRES